MYSLEVPKSIYRLQGERPMLHDRLRPRRLKMIISLTLTSFLYFSMLPMIPTTARVKAKATTTQDKQEPNIPLSAPGSAYRQTKLVSDSPGLAPVLDPLLVNPWGISSTASSPFWVANNGTSTTQLLRGDVGGQPFVLNASPQTITIPGGLPTGTVASAVNAEFV